MLGKVGVKLKIEIVEWGQWIERIFKKKEFQLTMIGHVEAWDIGIYANPDYYFQYDSQEFRDAYAKALKAPNEEEKTKWFGRCQEIIADDAVNGFLFQLGKTTVAAAIADVAARHGRRTLVCEMDAKGALANAFDVGALEFEPTEVAPNLSAMAMNTEDALREVLEEVTGQPRAIRPLPAPAATAPELAQSAYVPGTSESW